MRSLSQPDAPRTLAPNEKVGDKYRLLRPLGKGGMGEVWLARNESTGAHVAVKALSAGVTIRKDALSRFRREAQVGGLLSHRHIVQIFDLVEEPGGTMVLVMEHLRGENLDAYLARVGPLSTREAVSIVLPILSALQHSHDANVVHRDVTPGNIFLAVDSDGHVIPKLVDFGIAKHVDGDFQTIDGEVLGTPAYMAPELIRGVRDFNGTSDLFSVAVVLFELITGAGPFHATTPAAALAAVLERTIDPDARIEPRVWLEIARALSKRPYERHQSAHEMGLALSAALGGAASGDVNVTLKNPPRIADVEEGVPASRPLTGAAVTHTQDTTRAIATPGRRAVLGWSAVGAGVMVAAMLVGLAVVRRHAVPMSPSESRPSSLAVKTPPALEPPLVERSPEVAASALPEAPAAASASPVSARKPPPKALSSAHDVPAKSSPGGRKPVARSPGF